MNIDPSTLPRLRALRCQLDAAITALQNGEAEVCIDTHGRTSVELLNFEAGTLLIGGYAIQDRFPKEAP
jgi:hypothetical protein